MKRSAELEILIPGCGNSGYAQKVITVYSTTTSPTHTHLQALAKQFTQEAFAI